MYYKKKGDSNHNKQHAMSHNLIYNKQLVVVGVLVASLFLAFAHHSKKVGGPQVQHVGTAQSKTSYIERKRGGGYALRGGFFMKGMSL